MKGLLAILGKPSKDKGSSPDMSKDMDDDAPESGESDSKTACVDEAVAAAKDGDWDGFGDALKSALGCE